MEMPEDVYIQAHQMFAEHCERQQEIAEHYRSNRKGPMPPSRVEVGPKFEKPIEAPAAKQQANTDPETGHETVTTRRPDGTVVTHRKPEEGELFLWRMTGKIPKSFQGKVDI